MITFSEKFTLKYFIHMKSLSFQEKMCNIFKFERGMTSNIAQLFFQFKNYYKAINHRYTMLGMCVLLLQHCQ
jgi:hypothetical protein